MGNVKGVLWLIVLLLILLIISTVHHRPIPDECKRVVVVKKKECEEFKGLRYPSLQEAREIIEEDRTDEREYNKDGYHCGHYTRDLVTAFEREGMLARLVYLDLDGSAHMLVAVRTRDGELIYIEPQKDRIIEALEEGEDYCERAKNNCEWNITDIIVGYSFQERQKKE